MQLIDAGMLILWGSHVPWKAGPECRVTQDHSQQHRFSGKHELRSGVRSKSHEDVYKKLGLLSDWLNNLTDSFLNRIWEAVERIGESLDVNGIAILETEPKDWKNGRYLGGDLHFLAGWSKDGSWRHPAVIASDTTQARFALKDAELKDQEGLTLEEEPQVPISEHLQRKSGDPPEPLGDVMFSRYPVPGKIMSAAWYVASLNDFPPSVVCLCWEVTHEADLYHRKDVAWVLRFANIIFQYVQEGVGYRLISDINDCLSASPLINEAGEIDRPAFHRIAPLIADALMCEQVVIRLWPGRQEIDTDKYCLEAMLDPGNMDFFCNGDPGGYSDDPFVGEVLATGVPSLRMHVDSSPLAQTDETDPISDSYLAVPLIHRGNVIGAITCRGRSEPPWVFTEWEKSLLTIVGAHLGAHWMNAVNLCDLNRENEAWKAVVQSIGHMNTSTYATLSKRTIPDVEGLLNRMLTEIRTAVSSAANDFGAQSAADSLWISVQLLSEDRKSFRYASNAGEHWAPASDLAKAIELDRSFPVDWDSKTSRSVSEYVLKTGYTVFTPDLSDARTLPDGVSAMYQEKVQLDAAPIRRGGTLNDISGVINVYSPVEAPRVPRFSSIVEILGHQLGFIVYLRELVVRAIDNRNKANEDKNQANEELSKANERYNSAEKLRRLQVQVFQNTHHQVDMPLVMALNDLDTFLDEYPPLPIPSFNKLRAARAFIKRAWQASSATNVFRQISDADEKGVNIDLFPIKAEKIAHMLEEMAEDYRYIVNESQGLQFKVDTTKFLSADLSAFRINEQFFSQVVGNLMENVAKYSFENSNVLVGGGFTNSGNFYVSIMNKGLPIAKNEVELIKQRGIRGREAKKFAEGKGIGLWLANEIMKLFHGRLHIDTAESPTDFHEFRAIFGRITPDKSGGR